MSRLHRSLGGASRPLRSKLAWALLLGAALSFLSQLIQGDGVVVAIGRLVGGDVAPSLFSVNVTQWGNQSLLLARPSRLGRSTAWYWLPSEPVGPVQTVLYGGSDEGIDLDPAGLARRIDREWKLRNGANLSNVYVEVVGYPIASWYSAWIEERGAQRQVLRGGIDASAAFGKRHLGEAFVVCFFPLWPWAVFNWLFWSAFAWCGLMLVSFARVRRSAQRLRRGECVRCRYHVGDLPVCPECGTPSGVGGDRSSAPTVATLRVAMAESASGSPVVRSAEERAKEPGP